MFALLSAVTIAFYHLNSIFIMSNRLFCANADNIPFSLSRSLIASLLLSLVEFGFPAAGFEVCTCSCKTDGKGWTHWTTYGRKEREI